MFHVEHFLKPKMEVSIFCAVWAFVWVELLTKPGEIFAAVPAFLSKFIHGDCEGPDWTRCQIFKSLVGCAKCHAGQAALWYSIFNADAPEIIFCRVVFSIFFAEALVAVYNRIRR